MPNKILEARVEFVENEVERITVLVDFTGRHLKPFGDVRSITATKTPASGYMFILPGSQLTNELLQEVSRFGKETDDRDKIFSGWKKRLKIK